MKQELDLVNFAEAFCLPVTRAPFRKKLLKLRAMPSFYSRPDATGAAQLAAQDLQILFGDVPSDRTLMENRSATPLELFLRTDLPEFSVPDGAPVVPKVDLAAADKVAEFARFMYLNYAKDRDPNADISPGKKP